MNNKHKMLLLTLCAVALAAAAIFGTLAYLTDAEAATNTFTVGSVGLTLDEAEVNTDGTLKSEKRVQENEYHLLPGHTYVKDPTVTMDASSEAAYVRMMVKVEGLGSLKSAMPANKFPTFYNGDLFLLQNLCLDKDGNNTWKSGVWEFCTYHKTGTYAGSYEFRYKLNNGIVPKGTTELKPLFTSITVPGEVDNEGIAKLAEVKIIVTAHAIQAAGFADADAAWAAFDAQVNA